MANFKNIAVLGGGKLGHAFADAVRAQDPEYNVKLITHGWEHEADVMFANDVVVVAVPGVTNEPQPAVEVTDADTPVKKAPKAHNMDDALANAIAAASRPVIWATTGYDLENNPALKRHRFPVVYSRNFDPQMQQIRHRLRNIGRMLRETGVQADIRLIETHDVTKKDPVSGTALMWKELLGRKFAIKSNRIEGAMPTHELYIQFKDGRPDIKIIHEATSRSIYADGMLWALKEIAAARVTAGLHRYEDLYDAQHAPMAQRPA